MVPKLQATPTKLRYCALSIEVVINVRIFTVPTYIPDPLTPASTRPNTKTDIVGAAPEIAKPASKRNIAAM